MSAMALEALLIDGSHGEGGGQILRTALSIGAITGRPLRIEEIRAGRPKPGLAAQHLTAIRAAGAICRASVTGDELGSMALCVCFGSIADVIGMVREGPLSA